MRTGLTDQAIPPPGSHLAGPRVAWSVGPWPQTDDPPEPLVWHWCDHNVWLAKGASPELVPPPQWSLVSVKAHDLVQLDPLHLEPSLYWPGCCGLHGWLRAGVWTDA